MNNVKENKVFGLVISAIFLCIFLFEFLFKGKCIITLIFFIFIFLLITVIHPQILSRPKILWMKIGHYLGIVNTYVILWVLFGVIITPIGIIRRLSGKSGIVLKWDAKQKTYWETIENSEKGSFENQF